MKYNTACRLPAIFIFSFWCFSLTAQITAGYCITASGDSIRGTANLEECTIQNVFFKANGTDKSKRYKPNEVQKVVLENGTAIIPHRIPFRGDIQEVFLYSLVTGPYNLYRTSSKEEGTLYYLNSVQKPQLIKVNYRALETQFKTYFGVCAQSYDGKLKYAEASLTAFVQAANQCAAGDVSSVVSKVQTQKIRLKFGAGVSLLANRYEGLLYYQDLDRFGTQFPATFDAGIGIPVQLSIGKLMTLRSGVNYVRLPLRGDSVKRLEAGTEILRTYKNNADVELRYLEIPLGFTASPFPRFKITPVFGGGGQLVIPIVVKGTDEQGGLPVTFSRKSKSFFSWYFSAGLKHQIGANHNIELLCSYVGSRKDNEVLLNFPDDVIFPYTVTTDRLQFSLSYTFFFNKK